MLPTQWDMEYIHACTHTHTRTYTHTHARARTRTHTHTHTHTYTHTRTHTHTHTPTCTHTRTRTHTHCRPGQVTQPEVLHQLASHFQRRNQQLTQKYVHMYICTCIHVSYILCVHTCIYVYTVRKIMGRVEIHDSV